MGNAPKDYYAILHVDPAAPVEIIRASYRTLMQRLKAHPDLGGDGAVAAEINEAYAVLKDATKRAAYDASRSQQTDRPQNSAGTPAGTASRTCAATAAPRDGAECAFCGRTQHLPPERTADALCGRCKSPLVSLVLPSGTAGPAQRAHRVAKDEPLVFHTDWRDRVGRSGALADLSMTGLRFVALEPLPPGQLVRIECALFSAVARVAHCNHEEHKLTFQVGAQFVTVIFHRQRGSLVSVPV